MKGLSVRNLKYTRAFAEAYPLFVQTAVAQLETDRLLILYQVIIKIPWSHNIVLLDKVESMDERLFYAQKTLQNNWSRNVLVHQIESKLYHRQGKAITNFEHTLPTPQSDLAKELIKDPYKFDFLNLYNEYKERDLEKALLENLTRISLSSRGTRDLYANLLRIKLQKQRFFPISNYWPYMRLQSHEVIAL